MTTSFSERCFTILAALLSVAAIAAQASGLEANSFSLEVLWSTPIMGAPPPPRTVFYQGLGSGLVLKAQAVFPDGRVAFLGDQIPPRIDQDSPAIKFPVLLTDAEHENAQDAVVLQLQGHACLHGLTTSSGSFADRAPSRLPYVETLAVGSGGEVLVGGNCNLHYDVVSAPQSDGYVARLDATGRLLWEKTYQSKTGYREIQSLTTTPSGDLAISGADYHDGWLARLAPDGAERWNIQLGNNLGNAAAALPGDRLAVAGFDGLAVYTWIVDKNGTVVATTPTRDSVGQKYTRFGKIAVVVTTNAIYVVSYWDDIFHPQPVAVAKLQVDGKLLWSTVLSDTVVPVPTVAPTWKLCPPALAITPSGDAMIACALNGQIQLYRLDGSSGSVQESRVALPDCQADHPSTLFLTIRDDRVAMLSGSRPTANVAANCTWVGRLTASM